MVTWKQKWLKINIYSEKVIVKVYINFKNVKNIYKKISTRKWKSDKMSADYQTAESDGGKRRRKAGFMAYSASRPQSMEVTDDSGRPLGN